MSQDPTHPDPRSPESSNSPGSSLRETMGIFPGATHFEILGLGDDDRTPERVVSALQDQLAKLNAHPDAETPEADQLRMTLHAAAADAIRDALAARSAHAGPAFTSVDLAEPGPSPLATDWPAAVAPATPGRAPSAPVAKPSGAPIAAGPRPATAGPMQGSPVALEAMAHMILGMHGGWNDASRRHLMLLARTHGASPEHLIRTMQGMTRRGMPSPQAIPPAPPQAIASPQPTAQQTAQPVQHSAPRVPVPPQSGSSMSAARSAPSPIPLSEAPARVVPQPPSSRPVAAPSFASQTASAPPTPRSDRTPSITEAEAIARVRAIASESPDPTRRLLLIGAISIVALIVILGALLVAAIALSKAANRGGTVPAPPAPIITPGPGSVNPATPPVASNPTATSPSSPASPSSPTRDPNTPLPAQPPKPLFETPRATPAAPAPTPAPQRGLRRWDDMLRDLRALADNASADRAATADQFAKLVAEMARAWVDTTPDGHAAAADAVVELLFRMGGDRDAIQRMMTTLEQGAALDRDPTAEQVRARAFVGGVVARMARERDLPTLARARIDQIAPAVLGPAWSGSGATFRMGAAATLSQTTGALLPPVADPDASSRARLIDAWREWVRAIDAAEESRTQEGTRRILQGLEDVMLRAPDPVVNRAAYEVIGLLATSLTWRDGDASRDRLIRWFDAPGVTASDLHALTAALANSSAASSVDLSMVLSPTADPGQRAVLRDRYAAIWSLSAAGSRTSQVQDFVSRARGALAIESASPHARLASGAYMAHLNAVATYAWAGEPFPNPLLGGPLNVSTPQPASAAPPSPGSTVTFVNPAGTANAAAQSNWGIQYLALGPNIPARRELLQRVVGPLTKLDASVLAVEAVRGSPQQVRQDAAAVARRFLGDAAMIDALLDLALQIPATIDNTELLEAATGVPLPAPRDATWRLEVRRALVARLLEILGGKSLREVDDLSLQFADAYAAAVDQASPAKAPDPRNIAIETPAAGVSAIALRSMWQRRAEAVLPSGREPMTLAQINAARPARLRLAQTPIQSVSVEQANIAELMAFVVVAERPDTADAAAIILADLAQQRAQAAHIFDQLEAGERAILRLWMLRFGESTIPEVPTP